MAQLKDLLVTGPVRLLSDVVLGHDPTAALHAATKQYVDASAGKLTVGALTSGTTYYPILATGTGTATRQIDSSLPGFTYVKTNGTTGVEGTAVLSLGNTTASGTAGNASGRLAFYDYSGKKATILPRAVTSHTVDTALYLPDWGNSTSTYLVATTTTNAVGSSNVSIYVDSKGIVQQGATYAGGSKINLNGTAYPGLTASLYAPTNSGDSGQLLQSGGTNISPTWTNFADLIPVESDEYDVLDYTNIQGFPGETLTLQNTGMLSPTQCYSEATVLSNVDMVSVTASLEYLDYYYLNGYEGPAFVGTCEDSESNVIELALFVDWENGTGQFTMVDSGGYFGADPDHPFHLLIQGTSLVVDADFATAIDNTNIYNHAKVTVLFPEDGFNAVATAVAANEGAIFYVNEGTSYVYTHYKSGADWNTYCFSQAQATQPYGEEEAPYFNELRVSHSSTPTADDPILDVWQKKCLIATSAVSSIVLPSYNTLKPSSTLYPYRLVFTYTNGSKLVPICTQSSTSTTATKTITTTPIDPFGPIYYYKGSSSTSYYTGVAGANLCVAGTFDIRQSFYSSATISSNTPIYLKCAYNSSGQCLINTTTPFVYALPTTADSSLYILIGYHASTGNDILIANHPIYYYSATEGRVVPFKSGGGAGLKCYKIELPTTGDGYTEGTFQVTFKPIVTYWVRAYGTEFWYMLNRQESCTFKIEMNEDDCYVYYWDGMSWASNMNDSLFEFYVSEYSVHDVTGITQAQAEALMTVESVTL